MLLWSVEVDHTVCNVTLNACGVAATNGSREFSTSFVVSNKLVWLSVALLGCGVMLPT